MVSRENKRTAVYEKLQLLRSVTKSHAQKSTSIVKEASKYIQKLKQTVEALKQDIATASLPTVTVETLKEGFHVNVISEKNCPGLLVSILEAFEELHLNVVEARVTCTDNFQLKAVGEENEENVVADVVEEALLQAIKNWSERYNQQQ